MKKASSKTNDGFRGQAMNRTRILLIFLLALCYSTCPVKAAAAGDDNVCSREEYTDSLPLSPEQGEVHWSVLASGGDQGNVGGYLLGATVGQPCVGRRTIGTLSLLVGFWQDFGSGSQDCCGRYTGGETGNTDCDSEGKRTLSDVTTLIASIYVTHNPLCCPTNGNVDGDSEGQLTLNDIMRLIDNIYINHTPCAACP